MAKKIDKTRAEQEGTVAFIGTGVGIETPVTQEDDDLTEKIRAIVAEMLSNISTESEEIVGETVQNINTLILTKNEEILNEITQIWNSIYNLESGSGGGVGCSLRTSGSQTIPNAFVQTKMTLLSSVQYDTGEMYDDGNSQIIIPSQGVYLVVAQVNFGASEESKSHALEVLVGEVPKIGGQLYSIIFTGGAVIHQLGCVDVLELDANDVVSLHVRQATTGNISATAGRLTVKKLV